MAKQKSTKKAFLSSVLSLVLCMAMLIGTTFAWFTDSVTSSGNIIQSGKLDAELNYRNKPTDAWSDASKGTIFNYDKWEPGYVDVKYVQVANAGNLAFKYTLNIIPNTVVADGEVDLADVIDVYIFENGEEVNRDLVNKATPIGTLSDLMNDPDGAAYGVLLPEENEGSTNVELDPADELITQTGSVELGIALKMQESAGNEYQNLSVGGGFDVCLFATQYTYEKDSFDNQYDVDAPELVSMNGVIYDSFDAAIAVAQGGETIKISGTHAPITVSKNITLELDNATIKATDEGVHAVALEAGFDGKVIVRGLTTLVGAKTGNGIYVPADTTLDLSGTGRLIAKGNAGAENKAEKIGGSGIAGEGTINIHDLANLSAYGYGINGFGIGGATRAINVTNTTISYAKGGFVQPLMADDDLWGKDTPEGGAAIGSNSDGAVITLDNVVVKNAEGGSKAAGIGARYWTGVTVNIKNSTINVKGGNASAGIGGSRVNKEATEADAITINIEKSTINATGGQYGAGIGSGYDTYCHKVDSAPVTTVKIDAESKITAQGGKLAAGIGTGHNVVNFVGEINCDVTNVKAGDSNDVCCLGAECSEAQDVGLGSLKLVAFYDSVSVTADTIDSVDFTKDNVIYNFSGSFDSLEIKTSGTLNQIFNGADATVSGTVTVNAPGVAHNYGTLKNAERSGNVTVKGFDAAVLNVLAYNNGVVNIANNNVKSMSVIGGNFALNISGNTVDGDFGKYTDGENGNNEYGISLRICDYELSITDNVVTDAYSHAIGINGRQGETAEVWGTTSAINAFSGNKITVNTTEKTERAALKIWSDVTYAKASMVLEDAAEDLVDTILADTTNVFTIGNGHYTFNFYDVMK